MQTLPDFLERHAWMEHVFSAKAAQTGGVVRRRVRDVERIVGRELFRQELRRRGFRAIENNGHFVVFCNRAPLYRLE